MNSKRAAVISVLIVAIVALYWKFIASAPQPSPEPPEPAISITPTETETSAGQPQTSASAPVSVSATASASPLPTATVALYTGTVELPTLRAVREEVARDPHHTPPSLIRFAGELSDRAVDAKKSPEKAKVFFETLESCLENRPEGEAIPVAAQTLCLTTAEDLARLYPAELGERMSRARENAPASAKKLRNALQQMQ